MGIPLPPPKGPVFRETFPGTTFAMYRSRAFARVGGFDAVYYFFNEDLDWATEPAGSVWSSTIWQMPV